jgi:hypothetical protein
MFLGLAALGATACSDDAMLDQRDAGTTDAGLQDITDAATDAGERDASSPDTGMVACNALAPTASPETPAALTGRLDLIDFDIWDELNGERLRTRQMGIGFFTQTMPVLPLSDGPLFTAIAPDTCAAIDIPVPMTDLRPARNIGTELVLANASGVTVRLVRRSEMGELRYAFATQQDTLRFFDPLQVVLDDTWTWSTPGDGAANVSAAMTTVGPVEEFEVDPAYTATSTPMALDASGATIRWTPPLRNAGQVSIVLARALNMNGDGRYLVCRPADDGEFTISSADIAAFGPTRGLAFDLAVARAAIGAFCNEGVQAGAMMHTLVYLGAAVVP